MRKYILILSLVILAIICFCLMFFGIRIGKFKLVNSYNDVVQISSEKNKLLSELNYKNTTEFDNKKQELLDATKDYKIKKENYDKLVASGKLTENSVYNSQKDLYDVDFLWTTIGNYATEKNVTLQLDVSKSSTATSISSECVMCDLNFTITGEYIAITDFIYSIEGDDKLNFEISNFLLEKGGENLQATFVVKEVPINSKNLSSVPTTSAVYTDIKTEN